MKPFSENSRAKFDYEILETFEAGVVLLGQEVKSAMAGNMNLAGSFVVVKPDGAYLLNTQIPPYQPKNAPADYDPSRTRKLLLKKEELKYLFGKSREHGLTIVPLSCYSMHSKIKILIGLARRKKTKDKRELLKKRQAEKDINRALKK